MLDVYIVALLWVVGALLGAQEVMQSVGRRLHRVGDHMNMASVPQPDEPRLRHIVWSQVLVVDGESILLGRHRSGQFKGEYTGFIGEVASGETSAEAACRILLEQSGLATTPDRLSKRAVFQFIEADPGHPDPTAPSAATGLPLVEHEFICQAEDTSGTAIETETMTPTKFPLSDVPFDNMPADDRIW